jgi:hypothetical protein
MIARHLRLVFWIPLAAACSAPRQLTVVSNKAADAPALPPRVLFWSHLMNQQPGATFGKPFAHTFDAQLAKNLKACGVDVDTYDVTGVENKGEAEAEFSKRLDGFQPQAFLLLKPTGGVRLQFTAELERATYEVTVWSRLDPTAASMASTKASPEIVWRGVIDLEPGGIAGKGKAPAALAMADALVRKMRQDGLLAHCTE